MIKLKALSDFLLDFLFPNVCAVCGKDTKNPDLTVCATCLAKIEYIVPPYCLVCSQPLPGGGAVCRQCRAGRYHFKKIIAVGRYTGVLRELILKFKERDCLKKTLGGLLTAAIKEQIGSKEIDLFVPVPLSIKRAAARGYNQSGLLALEAGKSLGKKVDTKNLIRVRETKPQYTLTRSERRQNLKNAFAVKDANVFKGKTVVVVDDIATTCATFDECAKVLKTAGAGRVYAAALARD